MVAVELPLLGIVIVVVAVVLTGSIYAVATTGWGVRGQRGWGQTRLCQLLDGDL